MDAARQNDLTLGSSSQPLLGSRHLAKGNTQQVSSSQVHRQYASSVPDAGLLLDQHGDSPSNIESRLMELEQSLKAEKHSREKESMLYQSTTNQLRAKLRDLEQQLEMERNRHKKTSFDLIEKEKDAKNQRQLALDAVGELNRFLRGNQVPNQSTDDEIIQKVVALRIDIRDFAIIHFEGTMDAEVAQASLEPVNKYLRIPPDCLEKYIYTSSTRVNVIRAFLWAYLGKKVFNRFSWACRDAGTAFQVICGFLNGSTNENGNEDFQGKRKFHTWRANTASLLVEAMSLDDAAANRDCEDLIRERSNHISHLLEPLKLSRHQDYLQGIQRIICQSVELDKEIYKQIANIEWLMPGELPSAFVPDIMELELGQEQPNDNGAVTLVLGPGLVKHGKSSGDRFDMTVGLLRTSVFFDKFLGNMGDRAAPKPQDRKVRTLGMKEKFDAYRRRIGNALATERGESTPEGQ